MKPESKSKPDSKSPEPTQQTTRRSFLRGAGAATAAVAVGTGPTAKTFANAPGANDRIGLGLIGCGGRGSSHVNHWMTKLKAEGEKVDVVAACDVYRPRMQKVADKHKAKGYLNHMELLADPNVDVVCIATPDHIHGYQVLDAIKAKKDVYCEKPITHWRQFELTRKLSIEVPKSGQIFQLGTQGMSDDAWQQIRKYIAEGMIGQPIHAECGYFRVGDWGERGMPIDDPKAKPGPDLNWEAFLGDSPKRPFDVSRFFRWRMYEDYSGGPATDLFPHSLTPVVSMLGDKVTMPKLAVGTGGKFRYTEREIPDTFNMLVDYPENVTIAVLGTQGNDHFGNPGRGAGGRIPVIRGWEGTLTVEGDEIVFTKSPRKSGKAEVKRFPIQHGQRSEEFWKHFLACCRSRRKDTRSPIELAYSVQTALHMAVLALRNEKTVKFDAAKNEIIV